MISEQELRSNMDANAWASSFVKFYPKMDFDLAVTWFANAIMCGYDNATNRRNEEIEKLRGALSWYADEKNWIIPAGEGDVADYLSVTCEIQRDAGARAREVLG